MDGLCRTVIAVSPGYIHLDDEGPSTPLDGSLSPEAMAAIETMLARLDPAALEDGYGPCCNAMFDGSDSFITFPARDGRPERTVRLSQADGAPRELVELVRILGELGVDLRSSGEPAAAFGLWDVPESAPVTCEDAFELRQSEIGWTLDGPDGQRIDSRGPSLPENPEGAEVVLVGTVVDVLAEGGARVSTVDAGEWTLGVPNLAARSLPPFRLVEGQEIEVRARMQQAWVGWIAGLIVSDARGILFATDSGPVGVDTMIDTFSMSIAELDCPRSDEGCSERRAQGLRFDGGGAPLVVQTSEWGRLELGGGRSLAVKNLQSLVSGWCDDYWSYGYVAYAITGSDLVVCNDACQGALDAVEGCFPGDGHHPASGYGLGWPSCSGRDLCAAECMTGLTCVELACDWDSDIACDDAGPFYHCLAEECTGQNICEVSGGSWAGGDCNSCCGPRACGDDPAQECMNLCCGGPQCVCPADKPFMSPTIGCYDHPACHP
jgi:hypothetical protein